MYADLSPYEIARLKNIQENKKKLAELGLLGTSNPLKPKKNKVVFTNFKLEVGVVQVRNDGVKQAWVRDPQGYWIEINSTNQD